MIVDISVKMKEVKVMGGKMICVEGFRAFRGAMEIVNESGRVIWGDWLYKPDSECWYCGGYSYPSICCRVLVVE